MVIHDSFRISSVMVVFLCLGLVLIGGLLVVMRLRHNYQPNLIGALIGYIGPVWHSHRREQKRAGKDLEKRS